jgi:mannose-6-phosphate isomerase-like protein (cupin superfamily)
LDALFATCTADYVTQDESGRTLNLAQAREAMALLLRLAPCIENITVVENVRLTGDTLTAVVREQTHLTLTVPLAPGGSETTKHRHVEEVWVRTNGEWRLRRETVLKRD